MTHKTDYQSIDANAPNYRDDTDYTVDELIKLKGTFTLAPRLATMLVMILALTATETYAKAPHTKKTKQATYEVQEIRDAQALELLGCSMIKDLGLRTECERLSKP